MAFQIGSIFGSWHDVTLDTGSGFQVAVISGGEKKSYPLTGCFSAAIGRSRSADGLFTSGISIAPTTPATKPKVKANNLMPMRRINFKLELNHNPFQYPTQ